MIEDIKSWLEGLNSEWYVYLKRLSANDTGLTGGHQVGIYLPKEAGRLIFPEIQRIDCKNPDANLKANVDSHSLPEQTVRVIYYNNKHFEKKKNGRDEQRITQWKQGVGETPVQDVESTGALCIFAFHLLDKNKNSDYLRVWVCRNPEEENYIENLTGEIEPGEWLCRRYDHLLGGMFSLPTAPSIQYSLPEKWAKVFPTGREIIEFISRNFKYDDLGVDRRLIKRRHKEFSVFRAVEDLHLLEIIGNGFSSVESFVELANSVSNRRKSRSGTSLELHLENVFIEEGLNKYGTQCVTEGKKKPDFLFPGCDAYHDSSWPDTKLRMLAVKTTCKDRWRQILNEANRIDSPFLFTLQEGVSENQFEEMRSEGVSLVVPSPLHSKYPESIRNKLFSLGDFIKSTKNLFL